MVAQLFEQVEAAPPDPLFQLNTAFAEDPRQEEKVNLGIGAYKTDELQPYVFSAVREAEKRLVAEGQTKEYLPIDGDKSYLALAAALVFGSEVEGVYSAQALGGTSALRIGGDLIASAFPAPIYLPAPTWANHAQIFSRCGLEIRSYPYFDKDTKALDEEGLLAAIDQMATGSVILLHGCCHNPTGIDPTQEVWKKIAQKVSERGVLPFFDMAYQGLGSGLEEDAWAVRYFIQQKIPLFLAYSFSKSMGLYGERVGAIHFVTHNAALCGAVASQVKRIIRTTYSNPPRTGAAIVRTVLGDEALRAQWEDEVGALRGRIQSMRSNLQEKLQEKNPNIDFSFLARQQGMFSFTGLSAEQVGEMTKRYGIYLPKSGRMNVAGLSTRNIDYVVEAMSAVL